MLAAWLNMPHEILPGAVDRAWSIARAFNPAASVPGKAHLETVTVLGACFSEPTDIDADDLAMPGKLAKDLTGCLWDVSNLSNALVPHAVMGLAAGIRSVCSRLRPRYHGPPLFHAFRGSQPLSKTTMVSILQCEPLEKQITGLYPAIEVRATHIQIELHHSQTEGHQNRFKQSAMGCKRCFKIHSGFLFEK